MVIKIPRKHTVAAPIGKRGMKPRPTTEKRTLIARVKEVGVPPDGWQPGMPLDVPTKIIKKTCNRVNMVGKLSF